MQVLWVDVFVPSHFPLPFLGQLSHLTVPRLGRDNREYRLLSVLFVHNLPAGRA